MDVPLDVGAGQLSGSGGRTACPIGANLISSATAPEPDDRYDPNPQASRVLLRLPPYLHQQIKEIADAQGEGVNTLMVSLLAGGIERHRLGESAG